MLASDLRQKYLDFFKERGHLHMPGTPLIPQDALGNPDNTTLFTTAGMQQFKPYFTGEAVPPSKRVCTVQKCIRTTDIDSVGDYSHCTFFEMLGNFSFGDYFKAEVIPWTWKFLTGVLGIDGDRINVTVFKEDDEAFAVWRDIVGLSEDRIHRLGEDKNFWPANAVSEGPDGPCGPCSEIFYRIAPLGDMTTDPSLTPTQRYQLDDDAGRYVEIWNNVFTQYNRSEDEHGHPILTPLPSKNNDTGAGFDRIAYVVQGKTSVFETDLFSPILARIEELAKRKYKGTMEREDFAFRVVAEHVRCMTFCIGDGILPENEGRGYVLRRIMRRAIRFGKTALGFEQPFLNEVAPMVIQQMGDFYPEIRERQVLILKTIHSEEDRFLRTLDQGERRLNLMLAESRRFFASTITQPVGPPEISVQSPTLSGDDAFILYDTFGFPLELTQEIAAEHGMDVDLAGFGRAMLEQRNRSRAAASGDSGDVFITAGTGSLGITGYPPSVNVEKRDQAYTWHTEFVGYERTQIETHIVHITDSRGKVDPAGSGDRVTITLRVSPFYAESGGQIGDTGWLLSPTGATSCGLKARVHNTTRGGQLILHDVEIEEGEARWGQPVEAVVDIGRRRDVMRNHTATHLLHAALRQVLGEHVHQKGSLVAPDRLRFDFTHTQSISHEELRRIEEIVNERALDDSPVVVYQDLPIAEAKARGAMALFGEKYGDRVRMIEIPGFSLELCGGTHLSHTSQVGLFKIISQTGVAAGVRRIEAVTGRGVYEYLNQREETLASLARTLKTSPQDILTAVERLQEQRAQLEKQIQQLKSGGAQTAELQTTEVEGVKLLTGVIANADGETLAALADRTARQQGSAIVVVGSALDGKALFAAKVTPDLVKQGYHAGNLIREVAKLAGGGGGGRPDFAQAGGRDASKVGEALDLVPQLVRNQSPK